MKKNYGYIIVLMFLFWNLTSFAQENRLQGKVVDENNEPMAGVTVVIVPIDNEKMIGTTSGFDGTFTLTKPAGARKLKVSFIGYENQEIEIAGRKEFTIKLLPNVQTLNEVVITALGMKREKKALGYAVTEVVGNDLASTRSSNVINALAGRVAGLSIVNSGTGEWGSTNIVLRGYNSLSGNDKPLLVVDGVPASSGSRGGGSGEGGIDYGNGLSDINQDDIERITVLKGANAAALYGSRAANGVILITTKKGEVDKLSVEYNLSYTITQPLDIPELQNEFGRTLLKNPDGSFLEQIDDIYSWGAHMDGRIYTNWRGNQVNFSPQPNNVRDFYQTGYNLTNSISVATGNANSDLRISYANTNSESMIPNSELLKNNIGLYARSKYKDYVELSGKLTYYTQSVKNRPNLTDSPDNPMSTFLRMPRNLDLNDMKDYKLENGFPRLYDGRADSWDASTSRNQNPYWTINENLNTDGRRRMTGMASIKINFTGYLNLLLRAGTDYILDDKENIVAKRTAYEVNETRSKYSSSTESGYENNYDFLLNFNKGISDFGVNVSLGGNTMYEKYKSIGGWGTVLLEDKLFSFSNLKNVNVSQGFSQKKINSLYGVGSFDYKRYLYFEVTARNDWSSTLPPQNNSYFYSSASFSGIISDMFQSIPSWLSFSKVRMSLARVGSDTEPYSYLYTYSISPGHLGQPYGYKPFVKPLYDLKPEITSAYEFGTENHFFKNRLWVDFSYYYTSTHNQILAIASPVATGYSSVLINAGKVSNKGIEFELTGIVFDNFNGLRLETGATFSLNRNHIDELYQNIDKRVLTGVGTMSVVATADGNYGDIIGKRYKRDPQGRIILNNFGMPEIDKTADGNDLFILGNIQPDFMGGVFLNAEYKGLFFNALINYKIGGEFYSTTDQLLTQYGNSPRTLEGRDDWAVSEQARIEAGIPEDQWAATGGYQPDGVQLQGDGTYAPTSGLYVSPQKYWNVTFNIDEEFVHNASYVKLNQIRVGYRIPKKWISVMHLQELSVSFVGNNLLYIWKAAGYGLDPESSFDGFGIEYASIPTARNFGLSLNVRF